MSVNFSSLQTDDLRLSTTEEGADGPGDEQHRVDERETRESDWRARNEELQHENEVIKTENELLRQQLLLMKENGDLRTATVIAFLTSWMNGNPLKELKQATSEEKVKEKETVEKENTRENSVDEVLMASEVLHDADSSGIICECSRYSLTKPCMCSVSDDVDDTDLHEWEEQLALQLRQPATSTPAKGRAPRNYQESYIEGETAETVKNEQLDVVANGNKVMEDIHERTEDEKVGTVAADDKIVEDTYLAATSDAKLHAHFQKETEIESQSPPIPNILNTMYGINKMISLPQIGNTDKNSSERILGEVAYQLDRRIVSYVFSQGILPGQSKRRFYGYTVLNIPKMIELEWADEMTRDVLRQRFQNIIDIITPVGFNLERHPAIIIRIINSYGMLDIRPGRDEASQSEYTRECLHQQIIDLKLHPRDEEDMLCLSECLAALAMEDGKPIFFY